MQEIVRINSNDLQVKTWNGQRVVTLADIDRVHERVEGTAKTRYYRHKERFVENEDFFIIKPFDVLKYTKDTLGIEKVPNRGLTLITESGYLMIVKTYDDNLAWQVQRDLVNCYFKLQEIATQSKEILTLQKDLSVVYAQINNMESMLEEQSEIINKQSEKLDALNDYVTINGKQQQKLSKAAKDRVRFLLGGTHSQRYKENSRIYFKNLWLNFCDYFKCPTYGDLNPKYMKDDLAISFIKSWEYIES